MEQMVLMRLKSPTQDTEDRNLEGGLRIVISRGTLSDGMCREAISTATHFSALSQEEKCKHVLCSGRGT